MEIFTQVGGEFLSRWTHYLAGVTWIGLLYYFNFVQTPAFAEFEAASRTDAIRKLATRALWWFRWGAVLTLLSGVSILAFQDKLFGDNVGDYWKTASGYSISTGILLALFMFANVWVVIWPNQKIVIASAEAVAAGGEADPNAAAAGRKGLLASRTNTLFSIPMLFFMGATSHFAPLYTKATESSDRLFYLIAVFVVIVVLEANALGLIGGMTGWSKKYLETHRNTIIAGFVFTAVLYIAFEASFGS